MKEKIQLSSTNNELANDFVTPMKKILISLWIVSIFGRE